MDSIFTKIICNEIPGTFIYRDEQVVAFFDISPLAYGHTLVVPVEQVDRWTDLSPELWQHLTEVAQIIGQAVIAVCGSARAGEVIAGFDVPHTHIHVFPANSLADYNFANQIAPDAVDQERFAETAAAMRKYLGTDDNGFRRADNC
ncbi:HIT family protein [Corynebacterium choanae]|uniref:HIT-like protein n=1 Tax=Corynebacterium choanae TaxID=1862358 RepID=A0A3G6J4C6_9CORY|nr:HIT family protein [Corynebacterium choanae]AZA12796.1 HIT-like protein [Corynebacterium choanae]